ncbi:MAG: ABC transporter ATP-binding protein [Lachnospiraceae bacterium]|nr:ABC transporter ATP-binding protein [Lachnospiraceae bacterium]
MEEKYMIKVKDLCKQYGEGDSAVQVLNKVSFQVRKGECVAILGKSGSGKSTLLNVLGTLDKADSGEIYIGGENIIAYNKIKQAEFRRRKIGFIYQSYQLISILTVKDNILIPVQLDSSSIDWEYFHVLTKRLGIEQLLNRMPDQLSGGQRQRVAIARAMISKPLLILADEPTGNLDKENSLEVMDLLKECQEAFSQTILLVTHDLDLAKRADRVLVMKDGRVDI